MKKTGTSLASLLIATAICFGFTSCKQLYYQVYEVNSDSLNQKDNSLVYENNDLKVMYNLWGENGSVGFIVQNKTDKDLFLDMGQTFFIKNGAAYDYFKNREFTTTRTMAESVDFSLSQSYPGIGGYWPARYFVPTTVSELTKLLKGTSKSVTEKEKELICVPARAYKVISEYHINPELKMTCDRHKDFPHSTVELESYSADSSPLTFKNRLAYSFSKNGEGLKHIENAFYVSGISNYSTKAATEKVKEKVDCYSKEKVEQRYFKIGGPNKFYQSYRHR
jgi:hypothetical protein